MSIKSDYNITSLPREKAYQLGVEKLSDSELLAIILKTGSKEADVLTLSNKLLNDFDNLNNMSKLNFEKLAQYKGIGKVKAITLLSAFELGKRSLLTNQAKWKITSSNEVFDALKLYYNNKMQEELMAIYLDQQNNCIKKDIIFKGTINASLFHPREIFKKAIDYLAVKIILVHNHPSGKVSPSKNDLEFTKKMIENGKLLDIYVIDHIIIGSETYYSFYEHNPEFF